MLSWDCSLHWLYIIRIQYENTGVKFLGLQSWPSPKYWGKISGVAVLTILTPPQPHPHPEIDDRILKVQDCDQIKIVWTPNMWLEPTTTRLKVERSSNWANSVSYAINFANLTCITSAACNDIAKQCIPKRCHTGEIQNHNFVDMLDYCVSIESSRQDGSSYVLLTSLSCLGDQQICSTYTLISPWIMEIQG